MLARIRISVLDRPGMLGLVASAAGSAGADITRVDVLDSESGRATDDLFVEVRDPGHLSRVTDVLAGVVGLTVLGAQHPAPPSAGHAELELLGQVLAQPERALRTLADGAPAALGADWAAVLAFGTDGEPEGVVAASPRCPGLDGVTLRTGLRLASVELTLPGAEKAFGGTALVPLGTHPLGLVLVREDGPSFHRSELWRLGQIGAIAATVVEP